MEFIPQAKKRRKKDRKKKSRSTTGLSSLPDLQDGADIEAELADETSSSFQRREKRFTLKTAPKLADTSSDRFSRTYESKSERYSKKKKRRSGKGDGDDSKSKKKKKDKDKAKQPQTFAEWAESQSREFVRPKSDLGYVETIADTGSGDEWTNGDAFGMDQQQWGVTPITLGKPQPQPSDECMDMDPLLSHHTEEESSSSVSQALQNGKVSDLFLIELPSDLPLKSRQKSATESSVNPLINYGSGRIGKIRIRKSGKVEMVIGDRVYQLKNDQHKVSDVRTEAISIKLTEQEDSESSSAPLSGQVKPFGPIQPHNHFYCLGN